MLQEENAVEHYLHLIEQDKTPGDALAHASLRFGVSQKVILDRVNGKVADPERTRLVLAQIRSRGHFERTRDAYRLLQDLYEAITGEQF